MILLFASYAAWSLFLIAVVGIGELVDRYRQHRDPLERLFRLGEAPDVPLPFDQEWADIQSLPVTDGEQR